jgi:hypothetical protein
LFKAPLPSNTKEETQMGQIDLDKLAAARREKTKKAPVVVFGGKSFELSPEMPFAVVEAVRAMNGQENDDMAGAQAMADIARALFGERYTEFLALGPSTEDLTALLEHIGDAYGVSPGESEASES